MKHKISTTSLEDFNILSLIGIGAFGKVRLISKKSNGNLYALKSMSKEYLYRKNMADQIIKERNTLALSNCIFIVTLYYSFETAEDVHLIMEYMSGGDFDQLLKKFGFFDETTAAFYLSEVSLALDYLHKEGIIHRDIKPANFLMSSKGHLKLSDFGLVQVNNYRKPKVTDFNINKNSDMELGTPIQQSNIKLDQSFKLTRTPGQVLSLTSDFLSSKHVFSCKKNDDANSPISETFNDSITFQSAESFNIVQSKNFKRKRLDSIERKKSISLSQDQFPKYNDQNIPEVAQPSNAGSVRGTPDYLAPEIILQLDYDLKIDWWAVGVCLYQFLIGFPPFNDYSIENIFENIINGRFSFPTGSEALSVDAVFAITSLLHIDSIKRPQLAEIKKMLYFKNIDWPNLHCCTPPIIPINNIQSQSDIGTV